MSASHFATLNVARRGVPLSKEHRTNIAEGLARHYEDPAARVAQAERVQKAAAKISAANRGRKRSPEAVEASRLKAIGRKHTEETKQKIAAANRGRKHSAETRALLSEKAKGRKNPRAAEIARRPEVRAKMAATRRGRKQTPEHIEKRVAYLRGKSQPEWLVVKRTASRPSKKRSEESKAKQREAMLGRKLTPEHRLKIAQAMNEQFRNGTRAATYYPTRAVEYLGADGRLWRFRSSWERDVARQLEAVGIEWEYEPHKLLLSDGRVYIPDFWLPQHRFYIEVKGRKRFAAKVMVAIADGHPIELLFSNDIFTSPPLVARLGIATKRENHTLELVAS